MKHFQRTAILASLVTIGLLLFAPATQADPRGRKTVLTINEPVQIPNAVLAPGAYVFKLVDSRFNLQIVRVMNADETQVIATVLAVPNYRLRPVASNMFGFWEMPAGSPPTLRSWFYPGDEFGREFAYPKTTAAMIAAVTLTPEPVVPTDPAETKTVEVVPPIAETIPAIAAGLEELPIKRIPGTNGTSPMLAMVGLMSMGMALAVRTIRMP